MKIRSYSFPINNVNQIIFGHKDLLEITLNFRKGISD